MIACFDTNIYIGELLGTIPLEQTLQWRRQQIVRLCPVVYHELLRGARHPRTVYEIRDRTVALAPPTFKMWEAAALIAREYVARFGMSDVLHTLQNDILIALTVQTNGAVLITADRHFERLASLVPFHCQLYEPSP